MFGKRSDQPRTAEDRARAAADRAARRAGRPLPPDAFEDTVRPPDVDPREPVEEPVEWEEETPREDDFASPLEPEPEAPEPVAAVAAPDPEPAKPVAEVPHDPEPAKPVAEVPHDPEPAIDHAAPEPVAEVAPHDPAPAIDDAAPEPAAEVPHDPAPANDDASREPAAQVGPHDPAPANDDASREPAEVASLDPEPANDDASREPAAEVASLDPAPAIDDAAPEPVAEVPLDPEPAIDDAAPEPAAEVAPHDPAPAADNASPEPQADAAPSLPADDDEALAAARAEAAAQARRLRESAGAAQPEIEPTPDVIHQPTVEYTPFETEEHAVPEAPLGEPRDDEPRLVAARGVPREQDEIHAFAAAPRPETAEHDTFFETGEHGATDEPEARPPVPLRKAPDRPANGAAPRRRPAPAQPRRRPPTPKTPKGPRTGGGGHWGRRIFTLIAILILAAVLYAFNQTFQPFHGEGSGSVAVNIPQNTDAAGVAKLLAAKGVVDSARFFELNATISGERGNLRPGRYTLKQGMTNSAVIEALTKVPEGPKPIKTVDVTLVEGPSIKENDPVVKKSEKVDGSYAKAAASSAVLKRVRNLGAPKGTKTAEGFLFPATYKLPVGSPARDLVKQQLDAFDDNFKGVSMKYAKRKQLTRYDVLIIASMIEREAQLPRERRLVSAVIYNRLKQGMPLGIDATIRYATNNWQRPIRQSELDKPGPYNSRLNRSLPPTPIGNPGLASIKAAAHPSSKKYLFYVRKPGKSGEHAFSSTDAQFAKDVAKYQASRGGG